VRVAPDAQGEMRVTSGHDRWAKRHIPGANYIDLDRDLSDRASPYRFAAPRPEQFAAAMRAYGVRSANKIILYDSYANMWAARLWWMMRAYGLEEVAVLNGGWRKWTAEGRPTTDEFLPYPTGDFVAETPSGYFADRDSVRSAMEDNSTCLLDALTAEQFHGTGGVTYGRPGHIPTSVNVPAIDLVDATTHAYLPAESIAKSVAKATAPAADDSRIITYCGAGIAASSVAFVLTLLGREDVTVYDGSLQEWASDPSLPLETG
jgi:thiosulfate/3-mercaptopyruvate sulfurtransferase